MGRVRKRHVLFLAVLSALIFASEVLLRVLTPLPMTDFADATWDPHLLYRVPKILGANAEGFRERSDARTATIAAIGDSLTFGQGVDASKSWPDQVERMSGESVYNYSAPSYNIYQYYFLATPGPRSRGPRDHNRLLSRQRFAAPGLPRSGARVLAWLHGRAGPGSGRLLRA